MKAFAIADTYEGLIAAIRARRMQIGLSQIDVDQLAGLPAGYTSKAELSLTNPTAKNARALGRDSLPKMLHAVGLRLAVVAEAEFRTEKFKGRGLIAKATGENVELLPRLKPNRILAERGRVGGKKRWATMNDDERAAFLAAGAAGRLARRKNNARGRKALPAEPAPAPHPIAVLPRQRPKPPPLTKRQAAKARKRLVAERAAIPHS